MLEQEELALAEAHGPGACVRHSPREIERDATHMEQPLLRSGCRLSKPRPDPGDELRQGEGLRHVIGCAELQAAHLGLDVGQCRQDQHALAWARLHELLEQRLPVQARQQQVQHDELVLAGRRQLEAAGSVQGAVDLEPLCRERARDEADDPRLVVDDQDARHDPNARTERVIGANVRDGTVMCRRTAHERAVTVR